jgi:hypothetical protein
VAAWLLALAPSHVYFTGAAMTETAYTAFLLVGLLLAGWLVQQRELRNRTWFGYGLYTGFSALMNLGGAMLLFAPALTRRALRGAWHGAFRRLGWVLTGLVLVLGLWTVRNGAQVGVWSPGPTSNAMAICMGHHPGADGTGAADAATIERCFTRTPVPEDTAEALASGTSSLDRWLADRPDERAWYYRNHREALVWAATHPVDEARLAVLKVFETMRNDGDAIDAAGDFGNHTLGTPGLQQALGVVAGLWYYPVLVGGIWSVLKVAAVRRAIPLWATGASFLLGTIVFHGATRYHHAVVALLAVCAAGGLTVLLDRWRPVEPMVESLRWTTWAWEDEPSVRPSSPTSGSSSVASLASRHRST